MPRGVCDARGGGAGGCTKFGGLAIDASRARPLARALFCSASNMRTYGVPLLRSLKPRVQLVFNSLNDCRDIAASDEPLVLTMQRGVKELKQRHVRAMRLPTPSRRSATGDSIVHTCTSAQDDKSEFLKYQETKLV